MKTLILGATLALLTFGAAAAQGDHLVRGYTKADGTYVAPHYQTNPNNTRADNYSTQGNVNPYTGQPGTKPLYLEPTPYYAPPAPRTYVPMTPQTNPYTPRTCTYGQPC